MIERYIDQIITMEILADVITIIDDKGIIRYYKTLRSEGSVFSANEVVGQHFMEVFPHIKKEESTVLRALEGKTTLYKPCKMTDFKGDEYDILECVYPIQIKESNACDLLIQLQKKKKKIQEENSAFTLKSLAVSGKDLMEIGIPSGRLIGKILDSLLETVLDDPKQNSKDVLLNIAKNLYEQMK